MIDVLRFILGLISAWDISVSNKKQIKTYLNGISFHLFYRWLIYSYLYEGQYNHSMGVWQTDIFTYHMYKVTVYTFPSSYFIRNQSSKLEISHIPKISMVDRDDYRKCWKILCKVNFFNGLLDQESENITECNTFCEDTTLWKVSHFLLKIDHSIEIICKPCAAFNFSFTIRKDFI